MLFFEILPAMPPGCSLFLLAKVWVSRTFQTIRYVFPGCPSGLVHCFSVVNAVYQFKMPEKSTNKAYFKVFGRSLYRVFNWERNLLSRQSLSVCKCNIQYITLYCYTGCFHALSKRLAHISAEGQSYHPCFLTFL